MKIYAIDFETYYDESYGIQELGPWGYIHDDRFDPYLVAIYGEDIQWVGHPRDFDWALLEGEFAFVAHNAPFDRQVFARAVELSIIPASVQPAAWYCTSNLSMYLASGRSLRDAAKNLLGITLNKDIRDYMRGRTWDQAVSEGKVEELLAYGLSDAEKCYKIWVGFSHLWPIEERKVAEITFQQQVRGIYVDKKTVVDAIPGIKKANEAAYAAIPWAGKDGEDGKPLKPTSSKALKAWCVENGIPAPTTTDAKDVEFMKWQEQHKDVLVVKAMQQFRSSNSFFHKASTLAKRIRDDGRFPFELKYFGATTGRWSAGYEDDRNDSTGFNIQNLPKDTMFGLNFRNVLIPGPGKKFVIADYSQIEPRALAVLTGDTKLLTEVRKGMALYEAHARMTMGWKGGNLKKENPKLYALAKARVLALGYGAGWAKFIFMASMYGAAECLLEPVTQPQIEKFKKYINRTRQQEKLLDVVTRDDWTRAVNAWNIVTDFRASNDKITDLWQSLEEDCKRSVGGSYTIELPSGRPLKYFNVRLAGGLTVQKTMCDKPLKIWGGFLTENLTQATARDVIRDAMIKLEEAGIQTLFTVHDEIICEVDKSFDVSIVRDLMIQPPSWMPDIPLEVEYEEASYYKK